MVKNRLIFYIILIVTFLLMPFFLSNLFAQNEGLTIEKLRVIDSSLKDRYQFSSNEKIGFVIKCRNEIESSRVFFLFTVIDPKGRKIFTHKGNSVPGKEEMSSSSVRNIAVSKIYTVPGRYIFRGGVSKYWNNIEEEYDMVVQEISFDIYSPYIKLIYPPDGARDLIDKPLTFRWYSSGAVKYEVYVDDQFGFYNPIWVGVTQYPSIQYPLNPPETRQRLSGGTDYFWKVVGLDERGIRVAETSRPFTFSLKETSVATTARDLAVINIEFDELSTIEEPIINVTVKNQGAQAEANIPLEVYINGVPIIPRQSISFIRSGGEEVLDFKGNSLSDESCLVTASINFSDDNIKNNMLTENLQFIEELDLPKITGRVTVEGEPLSKVRGAAIIWEGPTKGKVDTDSEGIYEISGIPLGEYILWASYPKKFKDSDKKTVDVRDMKIYPDIDFSIVPVDLTLDEIWRIVRRRIKKKEIREDLEGYSLVGIDMSSQDNLNSLIGRIKKGRAKIIDMYIETEE